jgi:hypothetical protein
MSGGVEIDVGTAAGVGHHVHQRVVHALADMTARSPWNSLGTQPQHDGVRQTPRVRTLGSIVVWVLGDLPELGEFVADVGVELRPEVFGELGHVNQPHHVSEVLHPMGSRHA